MRILHDRNGGSVGGIDSYDRRSPRRGYGQICNARDGSAACLDEVSDAVDVVVAVVGNE